MTPMLLDSVIGIIILLSAIFAFFRGFVREMLTIISLGGAAASAYLFGPQLRPFFDREFGVLPQGDVSEKAAQAAKIWGVVPPAIMSAFTSYAVAFFVVFLILTLAGLYIAGTVKALGLGPLDKTLGVLFGLLRGFLLVFLVYLPFAYFMPVKDYPAWAKDSVSVAVLQDVYDYGNAYLKHEDEDDKDAAPGKFKAAADRIMEKSGDAAQDMRAGARSLDDKAHDVTQDILNDDEKGALP